MNSIHQKLTIPEWNQSTSVKESEAEFIYNLIKEKNLKTTLEVGFAYGRSAAHIMSATQSRHIAIDPFQENYENLGLKNIQNIGLGENLIFEHDFSHNVLPKLHNQKKTFDFIFIDGSHQFDGVFVDFYYADLMLEKGGYVLFHDTWMRGIQLTCSFIRNDRKDYKPINTSLRNLALFQKTGEDNRSWLHFREFYTFKSIVAHHVIAYINAGKSNFLKRYWLR